MIKKYRTILLCIVIFLGMFLILKNHNSEDIFKDFLGKMYNISYDEYTTLVESGDSSFEPLMRRDKFEHYFSTEGYIKFVANQQSALYLDRGLENKCNLELVSHSGDFKKASNKFWYTYEVKVNIVYLENSEVATKYEKGVISGHIINDEYYFDAVKIYYKLF